MTESEAKLQSGTHDLWRLWAAFVAIETEVVREREHEPRPLEDIQGIEAYIKQLDKLDHGSYDFRYPVTTKGEFTLMGVDQINVGHFVDCMERLCTYLDGFYTDYIHLLETDMDSNYDPGDYQ